MASDYRGELCNVVAILFLGLTWTAVLLRVYVRAIITKSFWTDDWLAVLTLVCKYSLHDTAMLTSESFYSHSTARLLLMVFTMGLDDISRKSGMGTSSSP